MDPTPLLDMWRCFFSAPGLLPLRPRILATTIRTPHSDDGGIDDIEDGPELQDYTP